MVVHDRGGGSGQPPPQPQNERLPVVEAPRVVGLLLGGSKRLPVEAPRVGLLLGGSVRALRLLVVRIVCCVRVEVPCLSSGEYSPDRATTTTKNCQ